MDLRRRPGLQNLSEMQHRNLVGHIEHNVHVMLDQENCEIGIKPA